MSKGNQKTKGTAPSMTRREKMRRRGAKIMAWILAGAMVVSVGVYILLAISGAM